MTFAEVVAIGDELTSGQRLDTNSQWLSQQMEELGLRVLFHSTVGDELQAHVNVLLHAVQRADIIVTTGGLGPTADDLTREAMALAGGVDLKRSEEVLGHIRQLFARRGRAMPERNEVQALFPHGSDVIPNPHGTAPGIHQCYDRPGRDPAHVFALPGVPAEMREMWESFVRPRLRQLTGDRRRAVRHHAIRCFGVGESDLEQMLPDLVRRGRSPRVGITVSKATITLRITAEAESAAACDVQIAATAETIRECLGDLVFGAGEEELQHVVVRKLRDRGLTLATIEWGSAGLLAQWLSEVDEAGEVFTGGSVERGGQNVPPESQRDAVRRMSEAARRERERRGADFGLAVGPLPTCPERLEERVTMVLDAAGEVTQQDFRCAGHPDILRARCAKQALNLLRLASD